MSDFIPVCAIVGPGSTIHDIGKNNFEIDGWKITAIGSIILHCHSEFPKVFDYDVVTKKMTSLESILTALFLLDQIPRKIFEFKYDISECGCMYSLYFGHEGNSFNYTDEQILSIAFKQTGWIFNHKLNGSRPVIFSDIQDWHTHLMRQPHLLSSLMLIRESFRRINLLFFQSWHGTDIDLFQSILLLISGLESWFLYKSKNHADLRFKFKSVGAAMYANFVDQKFLDEFVHPGNKKLSYQDFKKLLGLLYDFRSNVAHGTVKEIWNISKWNIISKLLLPKVDPVIQSEVGLYTGNLPLILGHLQKHILAIFIGAKNEVLNLNSEFKPLDFFDQIIARGASKDNSD